MKTLFITNHSTYENWNGQQNKFKQVLNQLLTFLTDYEIMFEGSREDLNTETKNSI